MKTLYSSRLILRPVIPTDVPELAAMLGDSDITKYLFSGRRLPFSDATGFVRDHFSFQEDDQSGIGSLIERHSRLVVGFAGLKSCEHPFRNDFELGFAIGKAARGKEYATEIGKRQIVFCFDDLKCQRVLGLAHPGNRASIHILEEKLKMTSVDYIEIPDRGPRQVFCLDLSTYVKTASYYRTALF
jgi:[ribosomal protein S5]-alanine N-acetyltransferase